MICLCCIVNALRPRQNGWRFADDIFKCIFLNENAWISIKIPLKFIPEGLIYIIGSDNGLTTIRRQAIIWTTDGLVPLPQWFSIRTGDMSVTLENQDIVNSVVGLVIYINCGHIVPLILNM